MTHNGLDDWFKHIYIRKKWIRRGIQLDNVLSRAWAIGQYRPMSIRTAPVFKSSKVFPKFDTKESFCSMTFSITDYCYYSSCNREATYSVREYYALSVSLSLLFSIQYSLTSTSGYHQIHLNLRQDITKVLEIYVRISPKSLKSTSGSWSHASWNRVADRGTCPR